MKKILPLVLSILLLFSVAACSNQAVSETAINDTPSAAATPEATEEPVATEDPAVSLPNPVVEVEDSVDFYDLGFIITPHQQAENISYSIIDNSIAQIIFTLDRDSFTYRAAITDSDISGVYETFDALPQSLELEGPGFKVTVLIRFIDGGNGGGLAQWSFEDVQYSFYTPDPTDYEALTDVLLPIIYYDLPFASCCG